MGFLDGLANMVNSKNEQLIQTMIPKYERATGRNYRRDLNDCRCQFQYLDDEEIQSKWEDLCYNKCINNFPSRVAIINIAKERGIRLESNEY